MQKSVLQRSALVCALFVLSTFSGKTEFVKSKTCISPFASFMLTRSMPQVSYWISYPLYENFISCSLSESTSTFCTSFDSAVSMSFTSSAFSLEVLIASSSSSAFLEIAQALLSFGASTFGSYISAHMMILVNQ